ncbi:hypothetical protein B0H13DRAFT_2651612 [Mycena leptocephala]|nr:hypothetical protein B0H13DRAFT_2651612 [Mycena leptocephala]
MENEDTTHQDSADFGFWGFDPPAASDEHTQQLFWSPVCFSSPSASTEYWSTNASPFFNDPSSLSNANARKQSFLSQFNQSPLSRLEEKEKESEDAESESEDINLEQEEEDIESTWCEQMTWSVPSLLEGYYIPRRSESTSDEVVVDDGVCSESILKTPEEIVDSLTQDEVDKNIKEMTCGLKLEEHFWPIRYKIRSGKLQLYENTINVLIVQARNDSTTKASTLHACQELHPVIQGQLSKLTNELASHQESSLSLTCFLDESRSLYARLREIASELQATELQQFREAVWKDSLIIILVLYEILTSKADLEEVMKLRGRKAQFMLDLMQDVIHTSFLWFKPDLYYCRLCELISI